MKLQQVLLADIKAHPKNPNTHPALQLSALGESLAQFEQVKNIVIWQGYILAGHGLVEAAQQRGDVSLEAVDKSAWAEDKAMAFMLADNRLQQQAVLDEAALVEALRVVDEPLNIPGFDTAYLEELGFLETEPPPDPPPQIDRAAELQQEYGTALGQLWQLGPHRVICGDCTERATVERVMGGEWAVLCHADPPYGMGKEKDGIANDNLYREKLDAFQMQWWQACRPFIEDNGSGYIWGNAEDLWRLWYVGGLKDSERLTFRNQVIWDKESGQGMLSDDFRMYAPVTEHCIFFMLGEQGFNVNADNYWEGWEPIRQYLYDERLKMGWDVPTMKRIVGHSDLRRDHWTSKSQWSFPTRDVYEKMQQAAKNEAFKRDYDELKRDFYATCAYFDNTHDNMTDVWQFPRVIGEERWGHATPKPVELIKRIIKSSSPEGALVLDPFLGSGTTLIAAHQLGRVCRGVEISPGYVAVTLQRFLDATGIKPELIR